MKKLRYKKNNEIFEIEVDSWSTNLFLEDQELFEGDLVVWSTVSIQHGEVCQYDCKIMWSDYFNGWALTRIEIPEDYEIPIGECGIPLEELNIY